MGDPNLKKATWTVMIYFAGYNNLNEECVYALKEIRRAGLSIVRPLDATGRAQASVADGINVIAQFDSGDPAIPTYRYKLRGGSNDKRKAEEKDNTLGHFVVKKPDTDEISYRKLLRDFIFSSMHLNPAENYMLILSGHGSGSDADFLPRGSGPFSNISIPDLRMVFDDVKQEFKAILDTEETGHINVLGMDSCLMGMAEVGYELREYVDYMVAAEGFESNTGWPYERILTALLNTPDIKPPDLAVQIVEKYISYYRDYQIAALSVDLSACDLHKCKELAAAIRSLVHVLTEGLERQKAGQRESELTNAILLAHWKAQSYKFDQYVDLYDFCDLLEQYDCNKEVNEACAKVKKVLGNGEQNVSLEQLEKGNKEAKEIPLVLRSCFSGSDVQYSHGLSIYFPWSQVSENYQRLEFNHATGWYKFLRTYVEKTRREPRGRVDKKLAKPAFGLLPVSFIGGNHKGIVDGSKGIVDGSKGIVDGSKGIVDGSKFLLANGNSSMKNPPIFYFDCLCGTETEEDLKHTLYGEPPPEVASKKYKATVKKPETAQGAKPKGGRKSKASK